MSDVTRYAIDAFGRWEAIPVDAGFFVKFTEHSVALDTQRQRAEKAEAELARMKEFNEALIQGGKLVTNRLYAAERRILKMSELLFRANDFTYNLQNPISLRSDIFEVLSPNPEAK